jgi:predicted RNA-binding Zn ribbon-like protein
MIGYRISISEEPGRRQPAPGDLRLVQEFLNTVDVEEERDAILGPEGLRAWLADRGLPGADASLTHLDVRRAVGVREALRDLLGAHAGEPISAAALETLNRAAASAPLVVRFESDGHADFEPRERGLDGALALILGEVATAVAEGTWARLKVCRNDACRWAFYDASKNRSGVWCTMAICGNRMKGRAFRRRRFPTTGAGRD